MAIYQSMQRVRFSSTDDYEKFKIVFADVRHHLKSLPGFLHLTWWTHPQDPTWHNEVSFWTSYEALNDWHMNTYHKHAKDGRCAPARSWRTSLRTSSSREPG
jgi:heme-degrading monooxygenase HmoA